MEFCLIFTTFGKIEAKSSQPNCAHWGNVSSKYLAKIDWIKCTKKRMVVVSPAVYIYWSDCVRGAKLVSVNWLNSVSLTVTWSTRGLRPEMVFHQDKNQKRVYINLGIVIETYMFNTNLYTRPFPFIKIYLLITLL